MGTNLELITPQTALEIFQCDKAEEIIRRIESEARSIVPDLSSDKGRKAIASTARKVSTSKVALDNLGKDLVADWKTKAKGVDAERKLIRDRLDALRDEVRQPLTEWENVEKEREQAERDAAEFLYDHGQALSEDGLFDRQREIERKEAEQAQMEQERLDREAAEKVEAERIEHDAHIAKEAEERAQVEAKEAADRASREAAEKIKAAEDAAEQARVAKIEVEQRAKIQAENAERDRKEAASRAVQEEIDRQADEKRKADVEQAKLEANKRHVGNVRREAKEGLMLIVDEATAKKIVLAISKGRIENITINY